MRECSGVHLEGEGCDLAVLRDEGKGFDCFDGGDVEQDVGEEDGLEADRHGRVVDEMSVFH